MSHLGSHLGDCAVQYTNQLHFGQKQTVHPQATRVEKDWILVDKT